MRKEVYLGVRLTRRQADKLQMLVDATGTTQTQVIGFLLEDAYLATVVKAPAVAPMTNQSGAVLVADPAGAASGTPS